MNASAGFRPVASFNEATAFRPWKCRVLLVNLCAKSELQ